MPLSDTIDANPTAWRALPAFAQFPAAPPPKALPNAAALRDNPTHYQARSTASGTLDRPVLVRIREAAHRRLNRGTRTRLRRVKTRQVHVTRSVPGATAASGAATSAPARTGDTRPAQRRLALNRFPAGHGDVPTEGSYHGATARLPARKGNAAILRQCGRRPPTPPAGHAPRSRAGRSRQHTVWATSP